MNGIVRWEEPPPSGNRGAQAPRRSQHWAAVAATLRENPGQWALVLEAERFNYAGGMAGQIKSGTLAAFRPAGSFDAQTRTVAGGYSVYARYVGQGTSSCVA